MSGTVSNGTVVSMNAGSKFGPERSTSDNITLVLNFGDLFSRARITPNAEPLISLQDAQVNDSKVRNEHIDFHCKPCHHDDAGSLADCVKTTDSSSDEIDITKTKINKLSSIGSAQSAQSRESTSDDSLSLVCQDYKPRPQNATKKSLMTFLEKNELNTLNMLPSLSATASKNPYKESWVKKKHYASFTKHHTVRDIAFDAAGNILLCTRQSVQFYDRNGIFQQKLYLNRVTEPWGIFVNKGSNTVLVSDHQENCVKEFNSMQLLVQEYGPVPAPCGVIVSTTNYVFVCSKTDTCVYVFDKNSNLITKLGENVLSSPSYVELSDKLVLVSDESRIIGLTICDEIEFVYGKREASRHPACLCVDAHTGYVLATNYYKHGVIAVRKDMDRALHIKDAEWPVLCAVGPYGNILIGERERKGISFKMYRVEYN